MSTLHANSCEDAIRRLETLVLLAGVGLPLHAVRDHLAAAVDLVVHIARTDGGGRRVVEVAEVRLPAGREREGSGEERSDGSERSATRPIAHADAVHERPRRSQRWGPAGPFRLEATVPADARRGTDRASEGSR